MRRLLAAMVMALAFAWPAAADDARVATVPGWISLTVPEGFDLQDGANGLHMIQSGRLRSPLSMTLVRGRMHSMIIEPRRRETAAGTVIYGIRESEGGSGGATWTLRIDHPLATIFADQQREGGPPDFAAVWEMVDTIRKAPAE